MHGHVRGSTSPGDDRSTRRWPLERILFAMAGTVTIVSALLAAVVSPWFLLLTAFVGVNQWLFVGTGNCPASLVLRRRGVCSAGVQPARVPAGTRKP